MNFSFIGKYHSVHLNRGTYLIECWGASGGTIDTCAGGAGGFSRGIIHFRYPIDLYIFPGGEGKNDQRNSFNGGGLGSLHSGLPMTGGGGGSTDVRIIPNDLTSRIIVAGGGGGAMHYKGGYNSSGGYGGGLIGGTSMKSGQSVSLLVASSGGNQTHGGKGDFSGSFGFGGNHSYAAGGGGGYYGGGGSATIKNTVSGGGGGSSFISGHHGCISKESLTEYHQSGYYFTHTIIQSGNEDFFSPEGNKETGHRGNGFVRITNLRHTFFRKTLFLNIKHLIRVTLVVIVNEKH